MALRNIRYRDDEILRKRSREVTSFDERLFVLLDDMKEVMRKHDGVGLAAVQIGVLKRVVVIETPEVFVELINPEIISYEGSEISNEGCLSFPNKFGEVERPTKVTVRAMDRYGKEFEMTGEGLLARAFCHEIDHLNGVLFVDKVIKYLDEE